ncbi:MAG: sel1 repeat family protein [archaeon]|nr:sel1 repeat family protein [archaeon]
MDGRTTGVALDAYARREQCNVLVKEGVGYALGIGVERSEQKASELWDRAMELGSVNAMVLCAVHQIFKGDEGGQDILENLASQGHHTAMFLAGIILAYRTEDVSRLAEGLELINGSDRAGYSMDEYLYENSKEYVSYIHGDPMSEDLYAAILNWMMMPGTEKVRYDNAAVRNYDPRRSSRIRSEALHAHWIHERAEQGDTAAEAEYGSTCAKNGYPQDAAYWWARAAKKGSARGLMMLGDAYLKGLGVECSEERGLELLGRAEEIGCAEASYRLALHHKGDGMYFEYLNRAASKGHAESCFILGKCYLDGTIEGGKCYTKAMSYFERVYTRHAGCMYLLGLMYTEDKGCRNRKAQGVQFMERAVKKGFVPPSAQA